MNIHEYQAKAMMRQYGIPVLGSGVAKSSDEAHDAAKKLGGKVWAVKAQVLAGGRGKAGGVKIAKSLAEVKEFAGSILGTRLVTHQTDANGEEVGAVLVEEGCDIAKEFYLALLIDRNRSQVSFIASEEGGMEIEQVAQESPEKIVRVSINPSSGFGPYATRKLAFGLGIAAEDREDFGNLLGPLYKFFIEHDCSLVEINPLVITKAGDFIALDAKVGFDDNALFRHAEVAEFSGVDEKNDLEKEAEDAGLSYIALDGNIGCMVNGAGLAMATMDIIKLEGGAPANFLDVGGGATKEAVAKAFSIILSDQKVEAILVNIFGGIVKCDMIAEGIITAAKELKVSVPLVVRLEGTHVALGKKLLKESGLDIIQADNLDDAAKKAVAATKSE